MTMSVILLWLIPALIIFVIAMIIGAIKVGTDDGGEDMIKNVYVYLVLFATLMMVIGGSVSIFMAIADIVTPAPYYQSFEDYKKWGYADKQDPNSEEKAEKLSDAELKIQYDAMVNEENARQINRAKNTLIKSFGWIIIPLPIFIFFQRRLAKK